MLLVDRVDLLRVLLGGQSPEENTLSPPRPGTVGGQVQPVRMRRVEKQLLRCFCQNHVRVANVEGHVAAFRTFGRQRLGQIFRVREGIAEDKPPPTAIDAG